MAPGVGVDYMYIGLNDTRTRIHWGVWYHIFSTGNVNKLQNGLVIHIQISCTRLWSTTWPWVGGKTGFAKIWASVYQPLAVSDLSMDESLLQQIPLTMMRPVASTAQSMYFCAKPVCYAMFRPIWWCFVICTVLRDRCQSSIRAAKQIKPLSLSSNTPTVHPAMADEMKYQKHDYFDMSMMQWCWWHYYLLHH